ncbi:polysaccharide deacetylase family protein [Magnetococcus sp. PR-3]|uniref:polysaccharide deacetylase family protein n=1 Tax=Magnetococcus sp. PR-3 TaxID=3120355 RepID=UPI002FCE0476
MSRHDHAPALLISVDVDALYHCRWASGSHRSRWHDHKQACQAIYGGDGPDQDYLDALKWSGELFAELGIQATFFILTEMASTMPQLVRELDAQGHEIALHGEHHWDNTRFDAEAFRQMIRRSREALAQIVGKPIVGYRAPNLIIESHHLKVLDQEGFLYDSSICPSRPLFGKFSAMQHAPDQPYHPSAEDMATPGDLSIVELPLGVFPLIRWPSSTGIFTRALGNWWSQIGVGAMLRQGYGLYYFHPWEVARPYRPEPSSLYLKLFLRRCGTPYRHFLTKQLARWGKQANMMTSADYARHWLAQSKS